MRLALLGLLLALAGVALAQPRTQAAETRKSGAEFMSPATQAMQRDDTQNPAMLWVADGEALWNAKAGAANQSCAGCHGDATKSMRGVAARFPAFDTASGKVVTLSQRLRQCQATRQQATPWRPEARELLALESYVALQSRGLPVNPPTDPRLVAPTERGRQLFMQRLGQLNLSCAQCHDQHAGGKLGGAPIPQGHASAYPIYRLEWQAVGSLQRRLRNCLSGVRAEVPAYDAQELVELELYLAARGKGMAMEAPGVRP